MSLKPQEGFKLDDINIINTSSAALFTLQVNQKLTGMNVCCS